MAFTRLVDDPCETKKRMYESTGVLSYVLDPNKYYNQNPCMIEQGITAGNTTSLYAGNMVNLENDLTGRTRAQTKCPGNMYLPGTIIQGTDRASCRHQRCAMSGTKCTSSGCIQNKLVHLPRCKMINYNPKITTTGVTLPPNQKDVKRPVNGVWTTQFAKAWTE